MSGFSTGGGKPFEIGELDVTTGLGDGDYFPVLQVGEQAARYWRIVSLRTTLQAPARHLTIFEIQLRQQAGVPEGKQPTDTLIGNSSRVFDGVTGTSQSFSDASGASAKVGLEFPTARVIREVAIYYANSNEAPYAPIEFDVEISINGTDWQFYDKVIYSGAVRLGQWVSFQLAPNPQQKRVSVQTLKEDIGGLDIGTLPVTTAAGDNDFLPILKKSIVVAKYWRIVCKKNTPGTNLFEIYELEFRQVAGVPESIVAGDTPIGNGDYPESAFDTNTSSRSHKFDLPPLWVGVNYQTPKGIAEVAVYFLSASNSNSIPTEFDVEYSHDGAIWEFYSSTKVSTPIGYSSWNEVALEVEEQQMRIRAPDLKESLIGDISAAIDAINGEAV